ncbi:hypothetical protein PRUPE_1G114200 [Prunus persica]|uniref:Uncharacterized protein n=1 Tax=Prunus persica TaxID=3760 RepID=A0A251QVV2_PRUPE|nr:hypothetical protein PRUPE_1G114200 [Prunus persica]
MQLTVFCCEISLLDAFMVVYASKSSTLMPVGRGGHQNRNTETILKPCQTLSISCPPIWC